MKKLISAISFILLFSVFSTSQNSLILPKNETPYRITAGKIGAVSSFAVVGVLWGGREAYHADGRIFEKKFGWSENGFFGSEAWQRQYVGGYYYDGAKHKPELGNTFRDFWHFSGTSRYLLIPVTVGVTAKSVKKNEVLKISMFGKKIKIPGYIVTLSACTIASSFTGSVTYQYLRN